LFLSYYKTNAYQQFRHTGKRNANSISNWLNSEPQNQITLNLQRLPQIGCMWKVPKIIEIGPSLIDLFNKQTWYRLLWNTVYIRTFWLFPVNLSFLLFWHAYRINLLVIFVMYTISIAEFLSAVDQNILNSQLGKLTTS
jgi:hypothetical protein